LALPQDYLEARDGVDEGANLISNFTNCPDSKEAWTADNNLFVRFVSENNFEVATGFNLTWSFYNKTEGEIERCF